MTDHLVWTEAMRAILRREWEAGTSARAIADMIGVWRGRVADEAALLGLPKRKRVIMRRGEITWTVEMRAALHKEWNAGTHIQAIAHIIGVSRGLVDAEIRRLRLPARKRNVARSGGHAGWTDALVARLTELWASGLSARLIADALRPFIPTIGTSSVTGKAQRLGLPQRGSPIKRRPVVVAPPVALPKPLPLPPGAKTLPPLPSEL